MRHFNTIVVTEDPTPTPATPILTPAVTPVVDHQHQLLRLDTETLPGGGARVVSRLPMIPRGFLFAGRATIVAVNDKGEQHTIRISSNDSEWPKGSGKKQTTYFLNVKAQGGKRWPNGSQSPYRYIGIINRTDGTVKLTTKSEFRPGDKLYDVSAWVVRCVFDGKMLPEGYVIHHAGKCGKCGKELTDSVSIDRGIGPDCWQQMGASL